MSELLGDFYLSEDSIKNFKENGFLKVSGLFTEKAVQVLSNLVEDQFDSSKQQSKQMFSRVNYDIGNHDAVMKEICSARKFRRLIESLIDERIMFTQGIYFELEKDKSEGFAWHYGLMSFSYIMPSDMGYSIWVPLDEINPERQGGGMSYISERQYSAREDVKKAALTYEQVRLGNLDESHVRGAFQGAFYDLFDLIAQEDSFLPGDALIFNRFVWHRSVPLREGELDFRRAFVMRFISHKARYRPGFLEQLGDLGYGKQSTYGFSFKDIKQGDLIASSKYANNLL